MYKRPANSIKTSGEYLFKTKNKTYELESYLFERQGDTEDSLQIQDELRGELGSILIKNSSWGKLSKGDPIRAKSSKGNISGVLVRAEMFSKGGNVIERRYVNKSEDYEVRYAKNKPKRTGYKNNIKFEGGGSIEEYKKAESDYDKYGEYLEDAIENGNEADIKKYKKLMDEAESIMHRHERKYAGGGEISKENQESIAKLQKLIDSDNPMITDAVKEKAKKKIEQLSKVEEVEDSELKKHIDSLSLSKFVDDASYILSADYDRIEGRASSKEGRDKITVELINKIEKSDDYEKSVYLKEIGFKSKATETKYIEIKVGQVYKINPKSKSIDNAGGLITVTEIDGGNVTISYTEKGKSKIDFISESMFNNLIKEGDYILSDSKKVEQQPKFKIGDVVGLDLDEATPKMITSFKTNRKGEIIYSGYYIPFPNEKWNYEESEIVLLKAHPKPTTKKADSVLKKTSTRMTRVANKEKKTEKILGTEYTVGTKAHAKAVAQKKHLDDLNKSETSRVKEEAKKTTTKTEVKAPSKEIVDYFKSHGKKETYLYNNRLGFNKGMQSKEQYNINHEWISKQDEKTEVKTPKDSWKEKLALLKKKKEYKGQIRKESKAVSGTKSRNIKRDLDNKALPKGKRISKDNKVYYENRANRSDINPKEKFEKGGEIKNNGWGINTNW